MFVEIGLPERQFDIEFKKGPRPQFEISDHHMRFLLVQASMKLG